MASRMTTTLALAVALFYCTMDSVSSQNTCGALPNTGLPLPAGVNGLPATLDNCCLLCQQQAQCSVALWQSQTQLCYLLAAGAQLDQSLLIPNQIGSQVLFPGPISTTSSSSSGSDSDDGRPRSVNNEDNPAERVLVGGLRIDELSAIIAGSIAFLCIVCSAMAYCRARSKQRGRQTEIV